MAGVGDSKTEYDRLQDALTHRLDAIAADIDAGGLSLEEGSTLANTLIDETRAKSAPLLAVRVERRSARQAGRGFSWWRRGVIRRLSGDQDLGDGFRLAAWASRRRRAARADTLAQCAGTETERRGHAA